MKLLVNEFEKRFENYPISSQNTSLNPLINMKLFIWEIILYIIEYDKENKNAYWFIKNVDDYELDYVHIPTIENCYAWVKIDLNFKPKDLLSLLTEKDKKKATEILLNQEFRI